MRHLLAGLFLLALALRAAFVLYHAHLGWQLLFDPSYYLRLAANLDHGVYSLFHPRDIPDTTRMPGYPFFIHLLGGHIPLVLAAQVVISAAKVPLVFLLARSCRVTQRAAFAAAALMAVEPIDVLLSGQVLTEAFFTTLVLAGSVALLASDQRRGAFLAALAFAAAIWIRPNGLAVVLMAGLGSVLLLRRGIATGALLVGASLVLVLPWVLRNGRETGRWVLSDSGPVAAAYFHVPEVLEHAGDDRAGGYRDQLFSEASASDWEDPQEVGRFFRGLRRSVRSVFMDHPLSWSLVQGRKMARTYVAPGRGHLMLFFGEHPDLRRSLLGLSLLFSLLLVMALAVWILHLRSIPRELVFVLLLAATLLFTGGISTPDARFKDPAMPLLLVGTAWAAGRIVPRSRLLGPHHYPNDAGAVHGSPGTDLPEYR
ncbi:MAG: hypothetical protein KDB96_12930 [Flavobacteriales bacterium]|nr:hypothetical protein [Flavobacteriales bacterium]